MSKLDCMYYCVFLDDDDDDDNDERESVCVFVCVCVCVVMFPVFRTIIISGSEA